MQYNRHECHFRGHVRTHLERNGEHQHSKDESPEGPVPKHLRGKRGRGGLVATINRTPLPPCIHGLVNILWF